MFDFSRKEPNGLDAELKKISAHSASEDTVNWSQLSDHQAWFDRPDASATIARKLKKSEIDQGQADLLKKWVDDGYVIVKGAIPTAAIDGVNSFIDNLFSTDTSNENITLLGYQLEKDKPSGAVPHRELVKLAPEERLLNARLSPWRIHELWTQCEAAKAIYENEELKRISSLIFDRSAYPRSTINFMLGSQQELHQDMSVFHIFPGNYLIGAWVALEDISIDSGPLRYAPGTHKSSQYPGFKNHPQATLRTCPLSEYKDYYEFTNQQAEKKGGAKSFLAKKGDVLLWHGMLVHGGSAVNNPALTRKSMVIHYLTEGVDQTEKIVGPFNWG